MFDIITTMFVQITIFTTDFVPFEGFDDWNFPLGGAAKENC